MDCLKRDPSIGWLMLHTESIIRSCIAQDGRLVETYDLADSKDNSQLTLAFEWQGQHCRVT